MDTEGEVHVPTTMHDIALQTHHTEAVNEISGVTGYRLLGLLLAIAGLVKTILSVKGVSKPLKMMDFVIAGIFGIIYLCLGWAKSSVLRFWSPFFQVDLSPTMFRYGVLFARLIGCLLYRCCYAAFLLIICWWPFGIPVYMFFHAPETVHYSYFLFFFLSLSLPAMLNIYLVIFIVSWLKSVPWIMRNIDLDPLMRFISMINHCFCLFNMPHFHAG